jgi:DNA-binding response OmpR family regulator
VHIVLVEDDLQLGEAIRNALQQQAYAVTWLRTGKEATFALRDETADAVLLDLGLPDMDGLDVLADARRARIQTPILIMTARDAVQTRVRGSTSAPTTISSSPSTSRNWRPASARSRGARAASPTTSSTPATCA